MEKETNQNKKKIKIKADTKKNKPFLLKKEFIYEENKTLILNKIVQKKSLVPKSHFKKTQINTVSTNVIKFNEQNSNTNENILTVSNISKTLGGRPILKNISLSLKRGKILGLLGPNGSGKSTLFNIVVGKIFPDLGKIKLNNEIINDLPIHKRALKGISLLEQTRGLFSNLTAHENLYAILELHIEDKSKIEAKISQLLSYFGLQYLANIKAINMSGGEYRKCAMLQRVCLENISVLLLDEPCSALDPISISSIKKFILELKSMGLSIVLSDHNFFAIQDILDNCIIIRDGVVMVEGPPKSIIKDKKAIKYYLGTGFKI